eukprot:605487-Amphidinium_carterae.1
MALFLGKSFRLFAFLLEQDDMDGIGPPCAGPCAYWPPFFIEDVIRERIQVNFPSSKRRDWSQHAWVEARSERTLMTWSHCEGTRLIRCPNACIRCLSCWHAHACSTA